MVLRYTGLAAALALVPLAALAQTTYRCVGEDGKKYYGQIIPPQCARQPIEELSPAGTVIRRADQAADEKSRAAKEAEAAKKREDDAIAKEESRRNRALLATYASEKDIDEARVRALAENQKAMQEVEQRIGEIKKRQASYDKEMEFFQDGRPGADKDKDKKGKAAAPAPQAKGASKPPPKLVDDMKNAEVELKAQENLLSVKMKDADTINAKYNEDKKRYIELTDRDAAGRAKALGMEKGVTVTSKPGSTVDELRNKRDAERRARQDRDEVDRLERERVRGGSVRELQRR
jgi:hypothetical protein